MEERCISYINIFIRKKININSPELYLIDLKSTLIEFLIETSGFHLNNFLALLLEALTTAGSPALIDDRLVATNSTVRKRPLIYAFGLDPSAHLPWPGWERCRQR